MFDSVLRMLLTDAANVGEWWSSIDPTYRASGCLLTSFALIWEATRAAQEHDRKFFFLGMMALGLLAYGAALFSRVR